MKGALIGLVYGLDEIECGGGRCQRRFWLEQLKKMKLQFIELKKGGGRG